MLRNFCVRLLAIGGLVAMAGVGQAQDQRALDYQVVVGVDLGRGWNSHKVAPTNATCVEFIEAESQKGQAKQIKVKNVTDKYQLQQAMNVSAEVSVKTVGFSGSGKASFAQDVKMNGSYSSYVVHAVVENGFVYTAGVPPAAMAQYNAAAKASPMAAAKPSETATYKPPLATALKRERAFDPKTIGADIAKRVPKLESAKLDERQAAQSIASTNQYVNPRKLEALKTGKTPAKSSAPKTAPQTAGKAPIPPPPKGAAGSSGPTGAGSTDPDSPNYDPKAKYPRSVVLHKNYEMMARENLRQFRRICGDAFVYAISEGGEISAVVSFETSSREEQRQIEAEAKGSGWGVEAGGKFQDKMKSYNESSRLSIDVHETGGKGGEIPNDLAGINRAVNQLAAKAASSPFRYRFIVTPYDFLPNWPEDAALLEIEMDPFEQIAREYGMWQTLDEEIESILNATYEEPTIIRRNKYLIERGTSRADLKKMQDTVRERLIKVAAAAKECITKNTNEKNVCKVPTISGESEMDMRAKLPLPLANPDIPIEAFLSTADYRAQVLEYWLKRINSARCDFAKTDPKFCLTTSRVENYKNKVPERTLTMLLRGLADWCLVIHHDPANPRALTGDCTGAAQRTQWTYHPQKRTLMSAALQQAGRTNRYCLYPNTAGALPSDIQAGILPIFGSVACDGAARLFEWTFEPSTAPGRVLLRNTYTNKCLDVAKGDRREDAYTATYDCIPSADAQQWAIILQ